MSKFFIETEIARLAEEIAGLVQILDKNEGGGGFLQSGRSRQTLSEARDRIKKISSTEESVQAHVRSLQIVLEGLSEGVLLMDRNGKILLFNAAAERLLSLKGTDSTLDLWLKRNKFFESDSKTVQPELSTPFVKALAGAVISDEQMHFQEKDASEVKTITLSILGNHRPQSNVVVAVLSEISEVQNLTHKLELLNASVQELKEGILVIDESGSFLLLNGAAKKLLLTDKPQGRVEDWLKTHVVSADSSADPMEPARNPFLRAMSGEKIQEECIFLRRQNSDEGLALKVTARSLSGKSKAKNKSRVSAVVLYDASAAAAPKTDLSSGIVDRLRQELSENAQQLTDLSERIAERDVLEHNRQTENDSQENKQSQNSASLTPSDEQTALELQRSIRFAVTSVLAEATSLTEVAPSLMQAICETMGWSIGFIWELDEGYQHLRRLDLWQVPKGDFGETIKWSRGAKFGYGEGLPGKVMQTRQPIYLAAIPTDDSVYETAEKNNLKSSFAFPIFSGSKITGVMQFFRDEVRPADGDLTDIFQDVSKQLSQFTEGKRAEEQRAQLTSVVESSSDAIVFVSLAGNILRWNRGAEVLYGHTADSMRGKPLSAIVTSDQSETVNEAIRRAKKGERSERQELSCLTKDGNTILVSILFSPLLSLDGGITGVFAIASNITTQKSSHSEKTELSEKVALGLEKLSEIREELIRKEEEVARLNSQLSAQASQLNGMKDELEETARKLSQSNSDNASLQFAADAAAAEAAKAVAAAEAAKAAAAAAEAAKAAEAARSAATAAAAEIEKNQRESQKSAPIETAKPPVEVVRAPQDQVDAAPPATEAVVSMAAARATIVKKSKKSTRQSLQSMPPVTAANSLTSPPVGATPSSAPMSDLTTLEAQGSALADRQLKQSAVGNLSPGDERQSLPAGGLGEDGAPVPDFMDLQGLKRLCGDNGMIEIVNEFLAKAEALLGQLETAVEQGDANACRRVAEELRSSAGALGAKQIIELSHDIQNLPTTESHKTRALCRALQHSFEGLKAWVLPQLQKSG